MPVLTTEQVLDGWMPSWDPRETGQFFTPLEMGEYAVSRAAPFEEGARVLEPCSGIGHLVYHLAGWGVNTDAYELSRECVEIGQKLCPFAAWQQADPFDHLDRLEGRYDYVLMNPPYNTTWGTYRAGEVCVSGAGKSEHLFMELATRALKVGGLALVIAPYNLVDRMPKKMRAWFDRRMALEWDMGELPGEFKLTKVRVHGFVFSRLAEPEDREPVPVPVQLLESAGFSVVVEKKPFLKALRDVGPSVGRGSALEILGNVLLEMQADGRFKVGSSSINTGTTTWLTPVEAAGTGAVTVRHRFLQELITRHPADCFNLAMGDPARVDMFTVADTLTLTGQAGGVPYRSTLKGLPAEEFPQPVPVEGDTLPVPGPSLVQMLKQVRHWALGRMCRSNLPRCISG